MNDDRKSSPHPAEERPAGVILVPAPSDSPLDPLNWPRRRKNRILTVLCLAAFAGAIAPLSGQLNLAPQAKLYGKTSVQESYANSAALAGMAFGPFFVAPVAHRLGRSSVILWCVLGTLGCQIWGAVMTHADDYRAFVLSRLFAGFFGAVPTVLGPRVITDLLFLHQRGRAFTALHMAFLLGTIAGPTFSAFISANAFFPVEFWWTVGLLGATAILVFVCLEETGYDRDDPPRNPALPQAWLANRCATFFFGHRVVLPTTWAATAQMAVAPILIGICPVTLIMGTFTLISFGFYVGMNALVPVWLQRSPAEGGYGFSLKQSAAFTFCHWIGIVIVQLVGHRSNDRLPLALARRFNHGGWKPEYRLHVLWIPSLVLTPIGLGLFGAALQYHLHYMVLALAVFLVTIGALASVPVTVNYVVECFTRHPAEAGIVVGAYRIVYGLTISFYIDPWVAAVHVGWVYGMMAFFAVFAFFFVMLLMWKGHAIRGWQLASVASSEEGVQVDDGDRDKHRVVHHGGEEGREVKREEKA
ncbi:polyamine transporter [Aspergillus ellipticus CBS 707.79]|uniref:Polyamine transporter n=1 Tax=Aspergillus ellipticus CBS 707.79 TaxID=1448320 RepID=A0A319CTL6_9EURO|nr:polyamine transporter [Aspergillus ellipticus CBS 707.79]